MLNAATRSERNSLYLGLEIGDRTWKVASTTGLGQAPRVKAIGAGDYSALQMEIERAKRRFTLPPAATVRSCYEAGRCGFSPHRSLLQMGIRNLVVDSSSIEVNRRKRRSKTDRLDSAKLSTMLVRHHLGDKRSWSVVRPPSREEEDLRQLHRSLVATKRDRTRSSNRIGSLLATQGVTLHSLRQLPEVLDTLQGADGNLLLPGLKQRIRYEWEKIELLSSQRKRMLEDRKRSMQSCQPEIIAIVRKLMRLKGIGIETAWLLTMEFFAWRRFRNVKQLGALAGLAPTPHQSGELRRELGITKSGNRLVRWILIEAAWSWLKYQPDSELSRWYQKRFGSGSARQRKVGIVALARKLLCALWKYVDQDLLPEGARVKT
jgi:transposase